MFENLFRLINKFASTLYYLLDNTNLLLQAISGPKHKHKKTLKFWKDWFNLIRNWFQLFRSMEKVIKVYKLLDEMETELIQYNDKVVGTTSLKATELVRLFIQ